MIPFGTEKKKNNLTLILNSPTDLLTVNKPQYSCTLVCHVATLANISFRLAQTVFY